MSSLPKAFGYGVLVWLVPFALSFLVFPLHSSERALFESVMAVIITATGALFAKFYFQHVKKGFVMEGLRLGILWLAISVAIDLLVFSWGPIQMGLLEYTKDIGITYIIYPIITVGFGKVLSMHHHG